MNYNDRLIWITGASSGIGEALAVAFSHRGARLVLTARRMEELARVRQRCADPEKVWIFPLDMNDHDRMQPLADHVIKQLGPVDMLINNAGITGRGKVKDTKLEVYKQMMNINFFGTVAMTQALLPNFMEQNKGSIVVISSVIGKFGTALRSNYSASKHALHGFFDALRGELWKHNVRVVMVIPGYVKTPITLNGLNPDGSLMGYMGEGQSNAMPVDVFAEKLIRALDSRKEEILIGGFREMMGVYLKRFYPRLLTRVLRKAKLT